MKAPKTLEVTWTEAYGVSRRWWLQEILRVQVAGELGSISEPNARRDRRKYQKELVQLRAHRSATRPQPTPK